MMGCLLQVPALTIVLCLELNPAASAQIVKPEHHGAREMHSTRFLALYKKEALSDRLQA
jgi:hypothetical protein